jgi:fatty-acyl-CoA synthase
MIISGGENIYPAEIENTLASFPGLAECAVIGLPDERWGEVPVLVLVRQANEQGRALQVESVRLHLQQHIARFKLPRRILFQAQLPKSALGKVQKPLLQRQLIDENS